MNHHLHPEIWQIQVLSVVKLIINHPKHYHKWAGRDMYKTSPNGTVGGIGFNVSKITVNHPQIYHKCEVQTIKKGLVYDIALLTLPHEFIHWAKYNKWLKDYIDLFAINEWLISVYRKNQTWKVRFLFRIPSGKLTSQLKIIIFYR